MLRGLMYLSLKTLGAVGISVAQVLECLRASPKLAELSLRTVEFEGEAVRPPQSTGLADLPCLQCLCIDDISPQATHEILTYIRIPNCSQLSIASREVDVDGFGTAVFNEESAHLETAIKHTLLSAPCVKITFSLNTKMVQATGVEDDDASAPLLFLNLSDDPATEWKSLAIWLIGVLETVHPLPNIHLVARTAFSLCRPILESQCPITTIDFRGTDGGFSSPLVFLELVDFLLTVDAGHSQWPLPHLRRLILVDTGDLRGHAVLSMVIRRYGRSQLTNKCGSGEETLLSMQLPAPSPLKVLEIKGLNFFSRDDIERLVAVIGIGQVGWDGNEDEEDDEEDDPWDEEHHYADSDE